MWFYIQKCRMVACNCTSWQTEMHCMCGLWVLGTLFLVGFVHCQHTRGVTHLSAAGARCCRCTFLETLCFFSRLLVTGILRQSNEHEAIAYNHILCAPRKMAILLMWCRPCCTHCSFQVSPKLKILFGLNLVLLACTGCFVFIRLFCTL